MPVSQEHPRDVDAPAVRSAGRMRGDVPGGYLRRRMPAIQCDLSGQVLGGRYRLLRPLGQGGMATIYEAEHVEIGKLVALKVLPRAHCSATVRRFLMEARAASQLRHENIIDVTDFGRDTLADGEPVAFMVMEYLEGEDLAATLEQDGPLRWTRVLAIGKQICRALIAAHDHGIVHCDIKPANCYRIVRGETADYIKVLDFGVASFACERTGRCTPDPLPARADGQPRPVPRIGTPGYMAGELLSGGSYDHRVDIYALGVLMYRLLTNKMPYPAARLYAAASDVTVIAPFPMQRAIAQLEISPAFEAVVLQALAQDPDQRHANARALYEALVAAEQTSLRGSPLASDPLCWGVRREVPGANDSSSMSQTEVSRATLAASSLSDSALRRTAPDLSPSSSWSVWAPAASRPMRAARGQRLIWPAVLVRATLALFVTTAIVRAAWTWAA